MSKKKPKLPDPDDLYAVLGVKHDATKEEIHDAFKKLAKTHHPDVNNGDDAFFKVMKRAHDVLMDDQKREVFDRYGFVDGGQDVNHVMQAFDALGQIILNTLPGINIERLPYNDLIAEFRKLVKEARANAEKQTGEIKKHLGNVEEIKSVLSKRLKRKEATTPDPFMTACNKALEGLQQQLKFIETDLKVKDVMMKILDEYTFDVEEQKLVKVTVSNIYTATTSGTAW